MVWRYFQNEWNFETSVSFIRKRWWCGPLISESFIKRFSKEIGRRNKIKVKEEIKFCEEEAENDLMNLSQLLRDLRFLKNERNLCAERRMLNAFGFWNSLFSVTKNAFNGQSQFNELRKWEQISNNRRS